MSMRSRSKKLLGWVVSLKIRPLFCLDIFQIHDEYTRLGNPQSMSVLKQCLYVSVGFKIATLSGVRPCSLVDGYRCLLGWSCRIHQPVWGMRTAESPICWWSYTRLHSVNLRHSHIAVRAWNLTRKLNGVRNRHMSMRVLHECLNYYALFSV
jgi:hypothetical protein